VHESVAEAFVAEAKKALIALYGEHPESNPDYSRIINAREVSRLASLTDPAKVVIGGESDPDARYLAPTIVYPISWDDKIMEDEVFGPVLPILTYRTLDEAFAESQLRRSRWRLLSSVVVKARLIASLVNYPSAAGASKSGQHPFICRDNAVRWCRAGRYGALLREIRLPTC